MTNATSDTERLLDEAIDLTIRLQSDPANPVTLEMIRTWHRILQGSGLNYTFPNATTVAISGPGTGNGAAATVDGAIALDTIDVSGGGAAAAAEEPYRTPGSSSYISREEIARTRGTTVGDTFKGIPGVLTGDDNNGPKFDVSIRGLGIDRVPVRVAATAATEYRRRRHRPYRARQIFEMS